MFKLTIQDFVALATRAHGDRYDYTASIYTGANSPIEIICKIHGSFTQKASHHTAGHGCPRCSADETSKRFIKSQEQFIKEAKNIHGETYDYSKVIYKTCEVPVIIVCKIHGDFTQRAREHLGGSGCQQCGYISQSIKQTKLQDDFIQSAKIIHNNKYDYSKVEYKGSNERIIIGCPIHGDFIQRASSHLVGHGCRLCGKECPGNTRSAKAKAKFIETANLVHNHAYDYSKVIYIGTHEHVEIGCKKHGYFWQTPANHLRDHGCAKCSHIISKIENEWLASIGIETQKQKRIIINGKKYTVDGFDPKTNTVYEFYGDYWHGNPKIYNPYDINKANKKTFKELYEKTIKREIIIRQHYNIVVIWEQDWKNNKTQFIAEQLVSA